MSKTEQSKIAIRAIRLNSKLVSNGKLPKRVRLAGRKNNVYSSTAVMSTASVIRMLRRMGI